MYSMWLSTTVNWSYHTNRFELGSRSDPASWLEEPFSILWLAVVNWQVCYVFLFINLVMLIDTYRSMIVRIVSPAIRGFLLPLLSQSCLLSLCTKENLWDQDMTVWNCRNFLANSCHQFSPLSVAMKSHKWLCHWTAPHLTPKLVPALLPCWARMHSIQETSLW